MRTSIARPLAKFGAQLAVIAVLSAGLSGCATIASLDPTGLLSDNSTPADTASATPDLASIPAAPVVSDDQRDVASSLAATGQQTQYSADALRAGTEAAAPAPGAAAPPPPASSSLASAAPPSANDLPPSASDLPPSASPSPPVAVASNAAPVSSLPMAPAPAAASNPNAAVPAVPPGDSVPGRLASLAPSAPASSSAAAQPQRPAAAPPGAEPAVPAVPPSGAVRSSLMTPAAMSDSALGFKSSTAPALDPSVSNFVSAPILARYRQTAGTGSGTAGGAVVAGGEGSVAGAIAASNGGVAPTAVIYFAGDGTALSAAGRAQVRAAVAAFKAGGGAGTVRVVGHASSRTGNMPVERHLEVIFEKSQKRANAVAQELIHQGVPAGHVQIDAVGDSQPVYYKSMPRGEEGNRRAEIFVQG